MAKATLSSGGGGSHGKAVSFSESILASIADSKPHHDAVCAMSLIGTRATDAVRLRFMREMDGRVRNKTAHTALGTWGGKRVRWYWPV